MLREESPWALRSLKPPNFQKDHQSRPLGVGKGREWVGIILAKVGKVTTEEPSWNDDDR